MRKNTSHFKGHKSSVALQQDEDLELYLQLSMAFEFELRESVVGTSSTQCLTWKVECRESGIEHKVGFRFFDISTPLTQHSISTQQILASKSNPLCVISREPMSDIFKRGK